MSKTERVPVKVYRWDDAGAPQVLPAEGDIKTILKACLVTGYGENENRKEPLGWKYHLKMAIPPVSGAHTRNQPAGRWVCMELSNTADVRLSG